MRYFIACALAGSIAVVIGCGPGKELPEDVPVRQETYVAPPDPEGKAPQASSAAAAAIADRTVKAITQDRVEMQAKARICRVTAQGKFRNHNTNEMMDTIRTLLTVWPNRARTTYEFKDGLMPKRTLGIRDTFGWMNPPLPMYYPPSEIAKIIAFDVTAQQWLPLSLELSGPKAVFFAAQSTKSGSVSTSTFKIGWPNNTERPIYVITCDDKTGLPVKINYSPLHIDQRTRIRCMVTFEDHKPFSGFMLPTSMTLKVNDTIVEIWTVDSWEFPETFDDKLFDQPK
jgi:hypothetical protein